jgi:hypothetical protein
MATDISIPSANLPAFLKQVDVRAINESMTSHATLSFPVLSLNGKRFTVVRGDEQQVLMNPKDPTSTAQYIEVVIVRAPAYTAKAYYAGGFNPDNEESKTPICFSSTGIIPDEGCKQPQCENCKTCPHNAWGSAVGTDGKAGKGKACRDALRVAIAPQGSVEDTMLLRVPPTSIRSFSEYGSQLTRNGCPYNGVITRISFDPNEVAQKLVFTFAGFVQSIEEYNRIAKLADSDTVKAIVGETPEVVQRLKDYEEGRFIKQIAPAAQPEKTAVDRAVATKTVTEEAFVQTISEGKVEKSAPTKVVETSSMDVPGLDDFSFDD